MAKIKYIKCPRCDLNYIDSRQDLCDVCKAEMGMKSNLFIDDDDIEVDEELTKLCPICKSVYIGLDETMCDACAMAKSHADSIDDNDEEWRNYMDDDPEEFEDEQIEIPLEELQEEEEEEEEEEYETIRDELEDDFDYVDIDDDDYYDDEDDEDDEDDYDDEDDEDDEDDKPARRKTSASKRK